MKLLALILIAVILFLVFRALTRKGSADSIIEDQSQTSDRAEGGEYLSADSSQTDPKTENADSVATVTSQVESEAQSGKAAKVASVAAAGVAAASGKNESQVQQSSAIFGDDTELHGDSTWLVGLDTEDQVEDIQEMFKILNLRDSDAPRLGIEADTYNRIKSGDTSGVGSTQLDEVADRLRAMFA